LHLQHVINSVYYVPGASNVGLVLGEGQKAVLIDTGIGQRSGRQLWQLLQEQGLRLVAILNTHGHGDHVGGNSYLVERTGARVYAPLYDGIAMQDPLWGTMCTFCGADPIDELRSPRFAPQPSPVDITVAEGEMEIAGIRVQVVPLPGHTVSHTGYLVEDVLFTGDTLAGAEELASATVSYAYSITRRLESLDRLRQYRCAYYVLGHGSLESDIAGLIDRNIAQVVSVLDFIKSCLAQRSMESTELLRATCVHYDIDIRNVRQYFLLYPTLHSYLSHLNNEGEIESCVEENRLLWRLAERR